MKTIEILGSNCGNCRALEKIVRETAAKIDLECEITKVTDPMKFLDYGISGIPALVIDDEVKLTARVPDAMETETLLRS